MRRLYWLRLVSWPSPLVVSSPWMRRSHRYPATLSPSQLLPVVAGPQLVKSFGRGIFDNRRDTHPDVSIVIRLGSRPNTLTDIRSAVTPSGLTGLPALSTVGRFE